MPSKPRRHQIERGIAYHVINRANRREKIFRDAEDYESFKAISEKYISLCEMNLYHYCLMPNHYHLLIEIREPERLSSAMGGINRAYSWYHHKKYKTCGFLWQGRFKSKPIQKNLYLLACGRYIERNPFVCGLVSCVENYEYSSAGHYVLGNCLDERQKRYGQMLYDPDCERLKLFVETGNAAGDEEFKSALCRKNGRLEA